MEPAQFSIWDGKDSEIALNILGVGYYGHLRSKEQPYSVYVVHCVNGPIGVQVSDELYDSILKQARPEIYSIFQSMQWIENE